VKHGLDGLRLYPVIGNHDTYPQDVISMLAPKANEAINEWDPTWFDLIPAEQRDNFKNFGYYVAPLAKKDGTKLGGPETKVIVLDSNICYQANW